jgi:CRISPR-associated protein Cas8a1/Csx13, MYXAN subtype/CRISPR-associated protein Cas8a1/Csx13, MYXAN subtype, C-terminal region
VGQLTYDLFNPTYTIYHRAALGGLACTIHAWMESGEYERLAEQGIYCEYDKSAVRLKWDDHLSDAKVVQRLLDMSFRVTDKKLIDLPGHGISGSGDSERVAIHNALLGTFLQHGKSRPGDKGIRVINVADADNEDVVIPLSYRPVNSYVHGTPLERGILNRKDPLNKPAKIPQSVVPGAVAGTVPLEAPGHEVFLLLYLMAGCQLYLVRSDMLKEKSQYCILVPDVCDLQLFTSQMIHGTSKNQNINRDEWFGFEKRVAGGAEEAALRFIVERLAVEAVRPAAFGIKGFQIVSMGKIAWDKQQVYRNYIRFARIHYDELNIFQTAIGSRLGAIRKIPLKSGEFFWVKETRFPAMVAANLVADRHWCDGFNEWVSEQKEFNQLKYYRKELGAVSNAVQNEQDKAVIQVMHEALRRLYGRLGERAQREGTSFERLADVELERMRNSILRAKSMDSLTQWFMHFCSTVSSGKNISLFGEHKELLYKFLFEPRNFTRFQNLCLFSLLSYESSNKDQSADKSKSEQPKA